MRQAIILCSGGIDSTVTAYQVAKKENYSSLIILFFNYGQRSHEAEKTCAHYTAQEIKAQFTELALPELSKLSTSLINKSSPHNPIEKTDLKDTKEESKNWYVPARNLLFLSYALALAEKEYKEKEIISDIFIGFKHEGKDWYLDATPEFLEKMNSISSTSLSTPLTIKAPLIDKDKEDIISLGTELGINFQKTHSCYTANIHCGTCLACQLRKQAFYWTNLKDPTTYQK